MSTNLTINGNTYAFPATGDQGWGDTVTNWATAVTNGMLQKAGGSFTLTAEIDFGATYGALIAYVKSESSNIASSGFLRLSNSDLIKFRNAANDGNISFGAGSADAAPSWGGVDLVNLSTAQTLTNKTLTSPVISSIVNSGTLTLPTSSDTLVGRATTDTLTNKTLTAPIISTISNTGTITLPTSTDTLVGKATTDTLTNKTLTAPVINTTLTGDATITIGTNASVTHQLKGRGLKLGDNSTTVMGIFRDLATGSIAVAGGSASQTGGYITHFGETHATTPGWIQFATSTASSMGSSMGNIGTWNIGNPGLEDKTSMIRMNGASALTGVNQQGILLSGSFGNSSATTTLSQMMIDWTTPNASFTTDTIHNIKIRDTAKGASHTVGTMVGIGIANQSMTVSTSRVNLLVGCTDGVSLNPSVAGNYNSFFDGSGVNFFNGPIKLATSGGTPTSLDYYEAGTFSANFNAGAGAGGANTTKTVTYVRLGKMASVRIAPSSDNMTAGATSSAFATAVSTIPTRLLPADNYFVPQQININGSTQSVAGAFDIRTDGTLRIFANINGSSTFASGNTNNGFNSGAIIYYQTA